MKDVYIDVHMANSTILHLLKQVFNLHVCASQIEEDIKWIENKFKEGIFEKFSDVNVSPRIASTGIGFPYSIYSQIKFNAREIRIALSAVWNLLQDPHEIIKKLEDIVDNFSILLDVPKFDR